MSYRGVLFLFLVSRLTAPLALDDHQESVSKAAAQSNQHPHQQPWRKELSEGEKGMLLALGLGLSLSLLSHPLTLYLPSPPSLSSSAPSVLLLVLPLVVFVWLHCPPTASGTQHKRGFISMQTTL